MKIKWSVVLLVQAGGLLHSPVAQPQAVQQDQMGPQPPRAALGVHPFGRHGHGVAAGRAAIPPHGHGAVAAQVGHRARDRAVPVLGAATAAPAAVRGRTGTREGLVAQLYDGGHAGVRCGMRGCRPLSYRWAPTAPLRPPTHANCNSARNLPSVQGRLRQDLALWVKGTILAHNGCQDSAVAALEMHGCHETVRRELNAIKTVGIGCDGTQRTNPLTVAEYHYQ